MNILKISICLIFVGFSLYAAEAVAMATNIGDIAQIVVGSFQGIGQLMIATSYLAGIGFTIASIFKFKAYRDNPTQITIGAPVSLLIIGAVMIFLPGVIRPVGSTVFGGDTDLNKIAGGFTGKGANALPGGGT
ncbi:MAG: hypothetical protein A2X78_02035 [Gammaproteobacteria bacterium GWE2_37_16]|nr:MAG: hypothetical protein A2X78_02035 [Gammaproteobacteria bacterium GWE2_37_16]